MKRVVLLSASPRKNGNSDILCHQFIKGVEDAGHDCELIALYDKKINFCRACYACFKTGKCVLNGMKRRKRLILSNMELTLKQRVMCLWIRIVWSSMM